MPRIAPCMRSEKVEKMKKGIIEYPSTVFSFVTRNVTILELTCIAFHERKCMFSISPFQHCTRNVDLSASRHTQSAGLSSSTALFIVSLASTYNLISFAYVGVSLRFQQLAIITVIIVMRTFFQAAALAFRFLGASATPGPSILNGFPPF